MLQAHEILNTTVVCDVLNLKIKRENVSAGQINVEFGLGIKWNITEVKAENKGLKCKVYYTLSGNLFDGNVEATVLIDTNRALLSEEVSSLETSKLCAARSAEFLVAWVATITSNMGVSPFLIPIQMIRDLISNAAGPK